MHSKVQKLTLEKGIIEKALKLVDAMYIYRKRNG